MGDTARFETNRSKHVSGKPITDQQRRLYMSYRQGETQERAAARAGISDRTGRRIERGESGKQRPPRDWRTRQDPLSDVWDPEILPLLSNQPSLKAVTLLELLESRYPEVDWRRRRRTLERRIRQWRATAGPDQVVTFPQEHPPGQMGLSDFTDMGELGVTIAGEFLSHRLYHFVLAYSHWEHVEVVLGGESYVALAEGLQNALWMLGGVPQTHRTDSLSAAYRNLDKSTEEDLTGRYHDLCRDYGMTPTRNNRGEGHENGSVESSHRHFKEAVDQALLLRGSRDFDDIASYRRFVAELAGQRNARRREALNIEIPFLRSLPEQRSDDFEEVLVRVTSSSGFSLRKVFYTVPSRLIGHRLKVRLFDDRLECYAGRECVVTLTRGRPGGPTRWAHVVDYRHVVHSLKCKPMALANLRYRDALLPSAVWRQTWEALIAQRDLRSACRTMVGLLALAHEQTCERRLSERLAQLLEAGQLPDLEVLRHTFTPEPEPVPSIVVRIPPVSTYDHLLPQQAVWS